MTAKAAATEGGGNERRQVNERQDEAAAAVVRCAGPRESEQDGTGDLQAQAATRTGRTHKRAPAVLAGQWTAAPTAARWQRISFLASSRNKRQRAMAS